MMPKVSLVLLLVLLTLPLWSQKDAADKPSLISEGYLSLNRTLIGDDNTVDRLGGGAGFKMYFFEKSPVFLTVGLEYLYLSFTEKRFSQGGVLGATFYDVSFHWHVFSLPVTARWEFGPQRRFALSLGGYATTAVHQNDLGLLAAFGFRIPVGRYDLLIRPSVNWGFYEYEMGSIFANNTYQRFVALSVGFRKQRG